MIDPATWMPALLAKAKDAFAGRLLFLGLQGSQARGEAGPDSDIDVVAILDAVTLADLDLYRGLVRAMPEGDKACGFIGGREQLANWPKADLFILSKDTVPYHGDLAALLPPLDESDLMDAARMGAGNLYHAVAHGYLYAPAEERPQILAGAFKSACFLLQLLVLLRTGTYAASRKQLAGRLEGREKALLATAETWRGRTPEEMADMAGAALAGDFAALLDWSGSVLRGL